MMGQGWEAEPRALLREWHRLHVGFLYAHKPSAGLGNVQFVQRS